jgi:hypothetical protein
VARPRFILLTQCLQNDFFLNTECRLRLPDRAVDAMLLGNRDGDLRRARNRNDSRRSELIRNGSLGAFLDAAVGRRLDGRSGGGGVLHLVNVRDWHQSGPTYDDERRRYGAHCEAGTWGAEYLDGLDGFLDPSGDALYTERGDVRVYHIRSDSLFDFKPHSNDLDTVRRKYRSSELEDLLDVLVQGTDEHVQEMQQLLAASRDLASIHDLARKIDAAEPSPGIAPAYVAVLGVYTDLKVQTLLVALRTQYDLPNLAVSDTYTASASLERHLAGLDYAAKVLRAEVVHGINDLVRFLGGTPPLEDESELVGRMSFARYESFFQDKQNVLAYQDEKLRQYVLLTERRSVEIYERIKRANTFLILFGLTFLGATLVLSILSAVWPDRFDWKPAAITGGVGLLQIASAFVSGPVRQLQQNLTNLAMFKMIIESHSLKTAFARFHLTTPQALREFSSAHEAEAAGRQIGALAEQLRVMQEMDDADFDGLARLALPVQAETTNGAAPAEPVQPTPATAAPVERDRRPADPAG